MVRALDLEFQSEAPSSSPTLTAIAGFIHSSPEFKFSTLLVDSQLVCLPLVGILNPVMFHLNYLFQSLAQQVKFLCNDEFLIIHNYEACSTRQFSFKNAGVHRFFFLK